MNTAKQPEASSLLSEVELPSNFNGNIIVKSVEIKTRKEGQIHRKKEEYDTIHNSVHIIHSDEETLALKVGGEIQIISNDNNAKIDAPVLQIYKIETLPKAENGNHRYSISVAESDNIQPIFLIVYEVEIENESPEMKLIERAQEKVRGNVEQITEIEREETPDDEPVTETE